MCVCFFREPSRRLLSVAVHLVVFTENRRCLIAWTFVKCGRMCGCHFQRTVDVLSPRCLLSVAVCVVVIFREP